MQLLVGAVILLSTTIIFLVDAQASAKGKPQEDSKKLTTAILIPTTKHVDAIKHHEHDSNENGSDEYEHHAGSNCSKKVKHHSTEDESNISIDITNIVNGEGGKCGGNPTCSNNPSYNCSSENVGCAYRAVTNSPHIGNRGFCSMDNSVVNYWTTYTQSYCHPSSQVPCFLTAAEQRVCHMLCSERKNDCSPLCYECGWDSTYIANTMMTTGAATVTTPPTMGTLPTTTMSPTTTDANAIG